MKKALTLFPLIFFGGLSFLLLTNKIRFGHGLGDIIYYPIIVVGLALAVTNYFILKKKHLYSPYLSFSALTIYATLIFFKMSIWRGPEYRWNGDILTPSSFTVEKRNKIAFEKQLEELNKLISQDSTDYNLLIKKGFLFRSNGMFKKAIEIYEQAQLLDNKRVEAYSEAGYAYSLMKDYENAVIEYENGYKLDTSNFQLKRVIKSLKSQHNLE